jgi:phage head maturation protease
MSPAKAWRSIKNGAMSLSIGYLVTADHVRSDGVRELQGIDLFEVSIVSHPANAETRIPDTKSYSRADAIREEARANILATLVVGESSRRAARDTRPIEVKVFETS